MHHPSPNTPKSLVIPANSRPYSLLFEAISSAQPLQSLVLEELTGMSRVKRLKFVVWFAFLLVAVPYAGQAHTPRGICATLFSSIVHSVTRHFLDRPSFVETALIPDPDNQPNTAIYIETRYIKHLRDKAHLSPLQVDRMIRLIKQQLYAEISHAQLEPLWVANDYKSVRLIVNRFDPTLIEKIFENALNQFHAQIDQVITPAEIDGKSALAILKSIPGYTAPFAIGIGRTMNEAGIAARVSFMPEGPSQNVVNFEIVSERLYRHALGLEKDRQALMASLKSSLAQGDFDKITVDVDGRRVFSPEFNDLVRKISDPQELALRTQLVFHLKEPLAQTLVRQISLYFSGTRVFEPPLAYRQSEVIGPLSLEPSTFDLDLLLAQTDYVASVDLRRVGAHHATALQAQLSSVGELSRLEFGEFIQKLSYGSSQTRYFDLLDRSEGLLKEVFADSEAVGAKTSGDEVTHYMKGHYSEASALKLLSLINEDMRATIVNARGFRDRGLLMSEDRLNEYRHLGETLAKLLHDELSLMDGDSIADRVRFLVEIQPAASGDPRDFRAVVRFKASDEGLQKRIQDQLNRSSTGVLLLLEERGIPEVLAKRLKQVRILPSE